MPPQIRECAGLLTIAGWAIGGRVSSYVMTDDKILILKT